MVDNSCTEHTCPQHGEVNRLRAEVERLRGWLSISEAAVKSLAAEADKLRDVEALAGEWETPHGSPGLEWNTPVGATYARHLRAVLEGAAK